MALVKCVQGLCRRGGQFEHRRRMGVFVGDTLHTTNLSDLDTSSLFPRIFGSGVQKPPSGHYREGGNILIG